MKNTIILFANVILLISLISANSITIEFPNGKEISAGDPINFKATLYDNSGNPIDGQIIISVEDSAKKITQVTVSSKQIATIKLGEASSGQAIIRATNDNTEAIEFFNIGRKELASFDLQGETLVVKNIGNTPYTRTIKITIGETTGTQTPNLGIGESASYRLVAPEGVYNLKVSDGETSLIRSDVRLTGTGNVIGAVDDSASKTAGITGGVSPQNDLAWISYIKSNKFVYVFIAVIFAATILIAVERRYKRISRK
ncbi:MAG: hypothetical protein AABW63_04100 [Nanoarchaeota archaeon]